jgi:hypothetical protein
MLCACSRVVCLFFLTSYVDKHSIWLVLKDSFQNEFCRFCIFSNLRSAIGISMNLVLRSSTKICSKPAILVTVIQQQSRTYIQSSRTERDCGPASNMYTGSIWLNTARSEDFPSTSTAFETMARIELQICPRPLSFESSPIYNAFISVLFEVKWWGNLKWGDFVPTWVYVTSLPSKSDVIFSAVLLTRA